MKAVIKIRMDNSAFSNNNAMELARVLKDLSFKMIENGNDLDVGDLFSVRDINGNRVGQLEIKD